MKKKTIILYITIIVFSILGLIFVYNIISYNSKITEKIIVGEQNNNEMQNQNETLFNLISESTYAKDPRIPENLLNVVDTHILKIKVIEVLEGEILPKMEHYYNPYQPVTPIKVELLENLYGEEILLKDNIIYMIGGKIRISNLIEYLDDVDIDRMGLNTLTEEEKDNKFIKYSTEFSNDIQQGKEYVIIVGKMDEGVYQIIDEGCGIFVTDNTNDSTKATQNVNINDSNGIILRNVLTNVEINQTELIQKAKEKKIETKTTHTVNIQKNKEK